MGTRYYRILLALSCQYGKCVTQACFVLLNLLVFGPIEQSGAQPLSAPSIIPQKQLASAPLRVFPGEYVVSMHHTKPMVALESVAGGSASEVKSEVVVNESLGLGSYLVTRHVFGSAHLSSSMTTRSSVPFTYVDTFCRDLLAAGKVSACSPNYELHLLEAGSGDPLQQALWGLSSEHGVAASRAWTVSTGSRDIVAAVIDTGIDTGHPDLSANMWVNPGEIPGNNLDDDGNGYIDDIHGINAINSAVPGSPPNDDNNHGTHVAGIIGAVGGNGVGVVGVVPQAQIMALKFLDGSGSGSLADAIRAIDYMIMMKTRFGIPIVVANNSWGGGELSIPLSQAFERARDAGIIMVTAAGNEHSDNDIVPSYPAGFNLDNVVSVAAVDNEGNLAEFSNYGFSSVDVAAPGVDIISTIPGGGYASFSGTSMAAPHVTGSILLLYAAEPTISSTDVLQRLYDSGRDSQSLLDAASGEPLVRTRRLVDVGRMVHREVVALPPASDLPPACSYDFQFANLHGSREVDTDADNESIVQQSDEGDFTKVDLPFSFPFFRGSVSTIYLSPNGVVYLDSPPRSLDYQIGKIAPRNAIAALHTDLVPRKDKHGIRVFKSSEKVTIAWFGEYFGTQDGGDVKVRLSLYPSGRIVSSVTLAKADPELELQRSLLGDPFSDPPVDPQVVIGVTGVSSRYMSSADLLEVQRELSPEGLKPLVLGVTMLPNCFPYREDPAALRPVVESVSLKRAGARSTALRTTSVGVLVKGRGNGTVGLRARINGVLCSQSKALPFQDGLGRARVYVSSRASSVMFSVNNVRRTLKLTTSANHKRSLSSRAVFKACAAMFTSFAVAS